MVLKIKNSKARCSVVLIMVLTLLFISAAIMPAGAAEPAKAENRYLYSRSRNYCKSECQPGK